MRERPRRNLHERPTRDDPPLVGRSLVNQTVRYCNCFRPAFGFGLRESLPEWRFRRETHRHIGSRDKCSQRPVWPSVGNSPPVFFGLEGLGKVHGIWLEETYAAAYAALDPSHLPSTRRVCWSPEAQLNS